MSKIIITIFLLLGSSITESGLHRGPNTRYIYIYKIIELRIAYGALSLNTAQNIGK